MSEEHKMSLGNMLFGNSRGEFPVPREEQWEGPLFILLDELGNGIYGIEFENDVFSVFPYWWGDCTCGREYEFADNSHAKECKLMVPNFHYKPTDFRLKWYKYAIRDSYMNQNITPREFLEIINECLKSLSNG